MPKVYQAIASAFTAYQNCIKSGNAELQAKHMERIELLVREWLPSGSGWDTGTKFDGGTSDKLIFTGSFHHMNESGMYDGWTDHTVTVTPAFDGINIKISGRDRNQIKDYLADLFLNALERAAV